MKTYFRLWCEWDYGQETVIFTEERVAKNWLYARIIEVNGKEFFADSDIEDDEDFLFDEGLAGLEFVTLIE
jgi:hypothetical protein